MSILKEARIIKACKKEEPKGQKALYELYLPYVLSICRRFGIPEHGLKDAIQEIFIEIFLNIKKYQAAKGDFKSWLKTITIRKLIKIQQKNTHQKTVELNEALLEEAFHWQIDWEQIDGELLQRLVAELPRGYRTVFNLYVIDGYSHLEIAQLLNISEGASRSQFSRARKILRSQLKAWNKKYRYGVI